MVFTAYTQPTTAFAVGTLDEAIPAAYVAGQSFGVNFPSTWAEVDANGAVTKTPLGTSGPFILKIGAEQILCSSFINGIATVWVGGASNGRGFNSTTAAKHQEGLGLVTLYATSAAGIQETVFEPLQAATVSAPAYVKGGMYFDTTLNKLRIGGATAWETVTSS